jgi:hypothetical protein
MNRNILAFVAAAFMTVSLVPGCQSSEQKVENAEYKLQNARLNVKEAEKNLDQTIKDSIENYKKFKSDYEARIQAYEKNIADLKIMIANERLENRAAFEQKLADLEKRNIILKKRLADYKSEEQTQWTVFKTEFTHDMEELGKALKDITVKNIN